MGSTTTAVSAPTVGATEEVPGTGDQRSVTVLGSPTGSEEIGDAIEEVFE